MAGGRASGSRPARRSAKDIAWRRPVSIEWSPKAIMTASRFLEDSTGMSAVVAAIDALADDPYPAKSFRWGDMLRLRVGR